MHCTFCVTPKKLDDLGFKWSSITAKSIPFATVKDATTDSASDPRVKGDETTDVPPTKVPPNENGAQLHVDDSANEATTAKATESVPEELPPVGTLPPVVDTETPSEFASPKPLEDESVKPSSPIEI